MLLNQIVFQHQRFQLGIRNYIFKSGDFSHHFFYFGAFICALPEIGTHPVAQTDGLSHINNRVILVMHNVDTGLGGELFQFFFEVKHMFFLPAGVKVYSGKIYGGIRRLPTGKGILTLS